MVVLILVLPPPLLLPEAKSPVDVRWCELIRGCTAASQDRRFDHASLPLLLLLLLLRRLLLKLVLAVLVGLVSVRPRSTPSLASSSSSLPLSLPSSPPLLPLLVSLALSTDEPLVDSGRGRSSPQRVVVVPVPTTPWISLPVDLGKIFGGGIRDTGGSGARTDTDTDTDSHAAATGQAGRVSSTLL